MDDRALLAAKEALGKKGDDKKGDKKDDKKEGGDDKKGGSGGGGAAADAPAVATTIGASGAALTVVVHPLVLLSVTDHYYRVAKDAKDKRVVGVILGESFQGRVDVTNSFAVPFEEDPRDPRVFFLDHTYLDTMASMFKKIAAKERILGFYSTGPRIRPADVLIDALFRTRGYSSHALLLVVDIRADQEGLPVQAYVTQEEVTEGGREVVRAFVHVPTEVGAFEAEEVGVEHLLRDINDPSVSHLAGDIKGKFEGIKGIVSRLGDVSAYLGSVCAGELAPNNEALYELQTALSLLPNTSVEPLPSATLEGTNDEHLAMYVSSLTRSVLALHNLLNNKMEAAAAEAAAGGEKAAVKEGEGDKGKDAAVKDGKTEGGKDSKSKS